MVVGLSSNGSMLRSFMVMVGFILFGFIFWGGLFVLNVNFAIFL